MSFFVALGLVIGIAASCLSIYEFLKNHKASGTIYAAVAAALILAAILISIIPTPSGSAVSGNNKPGKTPTSITTPQQGTTVTLVPTTPATIAPTQNPTPTSAPTFDYPAAHPGPGCDTGGGTWVAQGVNNITCSTWVSNITTASWGYLDLQQLPQNAAFAANNKISITFSNIDSLNSSCFGLAEQSANKGYLVAYCVNGAWTIYEISNQGAVIQTLSSNFTSIRSNTTLSLTLVNTTLIFAIDAESHQISISSIQPTEVAIAFYDNGCGNCTAVATNFNYITPAS